MDISSIWKLDHKSFFFVFFFLGGALADFLFLSVDLCLNRTESFIGVLIFQSISYFVVCLLPFIC